MLSKRLRGRQYAAHITALHIRSAIRQFTRSYILASFLFMLGALIDGAQGQPSDPVIFRHRTAQSLLGGRYSAFAKFQEQLQAALTACGKPTPYVVSPGKAPDGIIGNSTTNGVLRALQCPVLAHVPANSAARQGAITEAVWRAVLPDKPQPTPQERIDALVLTFEGTDFGAPPQWNFCQSGPHENPTAPGFQCKTNDPCSFVTWLPRGATAGGGREVQWILWLTREANATLVDTAFGSEAAAMRRFLRLKGDAQPSKCPNDSFVEKFLCTAWINPERKRVWTEALTKLGNHPDIQSNHNKLYASSDFDGGKVRRFFRFWGALGLEPTQADYAFFVDRATQTGGPSAKEELFQEQLSQVRECLPGEPQTVNEHARARRCYARKLGGGVHRLARDVAFYKDVYPSLTAQETSEWTGYKQLTIADLAISDNVSYGAFAPPSLGPSGPTADSEDITPQEASACPAAVLDPVRN